jgi:hypothetical protein
MRVIVDRANAVDVARESGIDRGLGKSAWRREGVYVKGAARGGAIEMSRHDEKL